MKKQLHKVAYTAILLSVAVSTFDTFGWAAYTLKAIGYGILVLSEYTNPPNST